MREGSPAGHRRGLKDIFIATLLGGMLFLMPFGLLMIVLTKLFEIVRPVGSALRGAFLPAASHEPLATILTVLLLLALALAAGLVAQSGIGKRIFDRIETLFLLRFPYYTLLRSTLRGTANGPEVQQDGKDSEIVLVMFDDVTSIGMLVERLSDGRGVVYLPGAPSAVSGSVAIVDAARLTPTSLTAADVFGRMRQLGTGLDRSLNRT